MQGFYVVQVVEEVVVEVGQCLEVMLVGVGGVYFDQCYEKWDQWGGVEKDQCGGLVNWKNSNNDQQWYVGCQCYLGQVVGIIVVYVVDLFKNKCCLVVGWFVLDLCWVCLLEVVKNLVVNFIVNMLFGLKVDLFMQLDYSGVQYKDQYQQCEWQQQGGCWNIFYYYLVQDLCQESGLCYDQQIVCYVKQVGNY